MKKGIIALICILLTLVLIIVALVGTWYGGSKKEEINGVDVEFEFSMTLTEGSVVAEANNEKIIDEKNKYDDDDKSKYVFDNTLYITIIALITAIIALIGILGITFNFGKIGTMKKIGGIFGILTVIFTIVAVIYFMTALPSELSKDIPGEDIDISFWDEFDFGYGFNVPIGPGYAWYLMIVGFIFSLIASIMIFKEKPVPKMTPPPQ